MSYVLVLYGVRILFSNLEIYVTTVHAKCALIVKKDHPYDRSGVILLVHVVYTKNLG